MWNKIKTPLAIIGLFIVLTFAYLSPLLGGKQVKQGDIVQHKGMSSEIVKYYEETGERPLWTNAAFSGMPSYQISYVPENNFVNNLLSWPIPHPANRVLFCLVFSFIMFMCFGLNHWLAAVGAIAYTFTSYNFILIEAGHNSKLHAIGMVPLAMGGIALMFRKKYLLGVALAAVGFALLFLANHFQIAYYLFMILGLWFVGKLIELIKEKDIIHWVKVAGLTALAAGIGFSTNMSQILLTQEYGAVSNRGESELTITPNGKEKEVKSEGLDIDYAFQWSQGWPDFFTFLIPNFAGGGSSTNIGTGSETYEILKRNGQPNAEKIVENFGYAYWGNLPFTSGPVYFGAFVIFLCVLGAFILPGNNRWWLLTGILLSFILAMGNAHFYGFNEFLFHNLPFYNKFRSVNMTLVIGQICAAVLAGLTLNQVVKIPKDKLWDATKKSVYIVGGLTLFLSLFAGMFFDFSKELIIRGESMTDYTDPAQQIGIADAVIKDRQALVRKDGFRSLFFILAGATLIYFFLKDKLKQQYFILGIALVILVDLWSVDKRHLNNENFVSKAQNKQAYPITEADKQILQDQDPNFKVLDLMGNPFTSARCSYFHKSIGGYHAAKLRRYQELIEWHLQRDINSRNIQNSVALNMLNTKYFIGQDQKSGQVFQQKNPNALGHAWLVKNVKMVPTANESIQTLNQINPAETVLVEEKQKEKLSFQNGPANGSIELTDYHPEHLTYSFKSDAPEIAVFSEIYYNEDLGWNAYINGQKVPHFQCNYVLRGMTIPAGNHTIEFKFEPQTVQTANTINTIANSAVLLLLLAALAFEYLKSKKAVKETE